MSSSISNTHRQSPVENGTPSGSVARKRRKVTRTRSGCLTCRKRRKACDMVKPDCGACLRLKKECCWPDSTAARRNHTNQGDDPPRMPDSRLEPALYSLQGYDEVQGPMWDGPAADLNGIFGSVVTAPDAQHVGTSFPSVPNATVPRTYGQSSPHNAGHISQETDALQCNPRNELLLQDIDLDEAMLQSWAANCLNAPGSQDPFQSLSEILGLGPTPSSVPNPATSRSTSPTLRQHGPLLQHYQRSLSKLVSCTTDGSPSSFEAFTQLATAQSSSRVGKGLHLGILAWAGRHMTNEGEVKYEALSERLGEEASRIVTEQAVQLEQGSIAIEETTRLTLLGGLLMLIQWKICRGDVWGYEPVILHLRSLADSLFTPTSPGVAPDSAPFSFFENLLYHDILSVRAYTKGPVIPFNTLLSYSGTAVNGLNTLTGACLPLFIRMYRIAELTRTTRNRRCWDDESLIDTVAAAERLEEELKEEKRRMDGMTRARPDLTSHRYLHEAFRIACLLSLATFVLKTPTSALRVRLLVRQALSLLEQMHDQNLPGYCSSHWVIFVTSLCCTRGGAMEGDLDDCERIEQLYEDYEDDWAFKNIPRSRRIAQEVRARNDEGRRYVDWIEVVEEYEWELWLV